MKRELPRLYCKALLLPLLLGGVLTACNVDKPTFPQETLEQSIRDICLKDYKIRDVEVKIVGKTIGVHLPLKKLFQNDIQNLLLAGKVKDIESFLQLSEDAVEKIQDVIFTTSRVVFSSDKSIDFYVVTATDVDNTGLEFVLANYVNDVKRVRFWDIALSEYYKRSFRDLKLNKSLFLKRPVLEMFRNVGKMNLVEVLKRYFSEDSSLRDISPFFYAVLMEYAFKKDVKIEVLDSKAKIFQKDEILVYTRVKETYAPKLQYRDRHFIYPSGTGLEYLFILKPAKEGNKIFRVLPFNYIAPDGVIKKIEFPETLKLYQNIETWPSDFEVEEIFLDSFISNQLNHRLQTAFAQDPKVSANFEESKVEFSYYPPMKYLPDPGAPPLPAEPKYFVADLKLRPKDAPPSAALPPGFLSDPNAEYVLQTVLKEFLEVIRGYDFTQFDYLQIKVDDTDLALQLDPESLERFRRRKISLKELLKPVLTGAQPLQAAS